MEDAQISKKEVADKKHRKPHLKYTKMKTEPKAIIISSLLFGIECYLSI